LELVPGTQVNPNVRLTRLVGEGAMGKVWVAEHITLGTDVAVKFISAELAKSHPDIVARFEREASVAAKIKSPHVVQTFDRGVMSDGTPYIVMELLEGESLLSRLDRVGRLSMKQTAQVVAQVARALRKAHELGIVHRDIKPDNIFVTTTEDGLFCKVLDFGIAKQAQLPKMGGLTSPGTLIGTPEYMSPEQVMSSKDVDEKADLWALAVTAYYCVTGVLPFTADALGALCVLLLKGEFEPASRVRPDLPPGTDAWFARALAKEPADRFSDARQMALAFAALLPSEANSLEDSLVHSLPGAPMPVLRPATAVGIGPAKADDDPLAFERLDAAPPSSRGASFLVGTAPDHPASGRSGTLVGTEKASIIEPARPSKAPPARWPVLAAVAAVILGAGGLFLVLQRNEPHAPVNEAPASSAAIERSAPSRPAHEPARDAPVDEARAPAQLHTSEGLVGAPKSDDSILAAASDRDTPRAATSAKSSTSSAPASQAAPLPTRDSSPPPLASKKKTTRDHGF
jgi:serine/threonine-protein kinase